MLLLEGWTGKHGLCPLGPNTAGKAPVALSFSRPRTRTPPPPPHPQPPRSHAHFRPPFKDCGGVGSLLTHVPLCRASLGPPPHCGVLFAGAQVAGCYSPHFNMAEVTTSGPPCFEGNNFKLNINTIDVSTAVHLAA